MSEMFPVFTDGKRFWHSHDKNCSDGCRFAYFSKFNFGKEWKAEIKEIQNPEKAKEVYKSWGAEKEAKKK